MHYRRLTIATILGLAVACTTPEQTDSHGDIGGTLLIALPAEPGTLFPLYVEGGHEKEIADQIFDPLAEIGGDLNTLGDAGWKPRLAESWQWATDSQSIAFKVNPKARWHDGRPVTSSDVRFSLELYKDPKVGSRFATDLQNVDSISTPDSATAVAWFARRSPEQFYNLANSFLILPEHVLKDADRSKLREHPYGRSPVGSGAFKFVRWEARSLVEVAADTTYHLGRPLLNRVIWTLNPDPTAALVNVLAGEVDVFESLTTDAMNRLAGQDRVSAIPYQSPNYGYLGFNLGDPRRPERPHSLFGDKELRRALSMTINRRLLLKNVFDSLGTIAYGPFSHILATADTTLAAADIDSAGADRLLDSLGWRDANGDGVREKGGHQLQFGLLVPATSISRKRYAELIQAQLRPHGVRVDVDIVEFPVFQSRLTAGKFDAVVNNIVTDPSPQSLQSYWRTMPAKARGTNFLLYGRSTVDAQIDSAVNAMDPSQSAVHYRNAYREIVNDYPAVWLYENRSFMAVNRRVSTVIEPGFWWRQLRLWSIPPGGRLPRDK